MTSDDPDSLAARFRDGDPEAFRILFDACAPTLQARLQRQMRGAIQRKLSASDLLQEARLAAWEYRESFEDRGPDAFRKWLLGILDHRLRRAREQHAAGKRDAAREVSRDRRAETRELRGHHPSPSKWAMANELQHRVLAAIDALPEPCREVVRLTHGEKLGLREVADRIGKSYDATRKIHARALARLKAVLRPDHGGDDA